MDSRTQALTDSATNNQFFLPQKSKQLGIVQMDTTKNQELKTKNQKSTESSQNTTEFGQSIVKMSQHRNKLIHSPPIV